VGTNLIKQRPAAKLMVDLKFRWVFSRRSATRLKRLRRPTPCSMRERALYKVRAKKAGLFFSLALWGMTGAMPRFLAASQGQDVASLKDLRRGSRRPAECGRRFLARRAEHALVPPGLDLELGNLDGQVVQRLHCERHHELPPFERTGARRPLSAGLTAIHS
jgi:hypothetical protein